MSSNLPSFLGSSLAATPARRDLGRIDRATNREVAVVHARARVIAEQGRASTMAIESVGIDAMQSGVQVCRHANALANACPIAEPMLRAIVETTGLALNQVVTDTARSLR